jgi:hypothetical protein
MTHIMIIGSERDFHAQLIKDKLLAHGTPCFLYDTMAFPETLKMSLTPKDPKSAGFLVTPEGQKLSLEDITAVYWRYHHGINLSKQVDPEIGSMIYREIDSALGSLWRNMPYALWVNPVSAIERHRYKTHQLLLMAEAGIRIPDTLVSNDPDAVRAFCHKHGQVIYKPVSGGAHTSKVTEADLGDDRLKDLALSPVQFQEMIEGVDVRVYIIGEHLYAAEIRAGTIDFRDNPHAEIVPIEIPDAIAEQCHLLARLFEYRFTGIDLRRSPDGEYCFIEGNPSPMFAHFEDKTGFPISENLITLLEGGLS